MLKFNNQKLALALILATTLLTSCSSKKKDAKSKQAELYFGAGTQSLMNQQYTEALKNLIKANELDPNNSEILTNLGMAYYFKDEKDLSIKVLNQALKIDDKNSDARINLASIYYQDKNFTEAERLYKIVLKDLTYEKQARTYYNLGILELEIKKNFALAEDYFKKSIKEDDNYCPSLFQLGLLHYNQKKFNTALKSLQNATIGTCYDSPAPHYYQALTMIELGNYTDARIKLDEIDHRFKQNVYAVKARSKVIELNTIENKKASPSHAKRNVLESPDF
jgi:type IV pilus assembly protein PilF